MKNWFIDFAKGIGIGISAMIPGVSGGTFAVVSKCYNKLVNGISNLFKSFVKSFLTLLPIALGCIVGLLVSLIGFSYAFNYILFSVILLFLGLIIGSLPSIHKEIKNEKITAKRGLIFGICFFIVIVLSITSFTLEMTAEYSASALFANPKWYLYLIMLFAGIIASCALVVPGISGSMILFIMGLYSPIIEKIMSILKFEDNLLLNISLVAVFAIGVIVGFFAISKLMNYLLNKHRTATYFGILGFVCGSIPSMLLNKDAWLGDGEIYKGLLNQRWELAIAIPLLILGFVLSFFILKLVDKKDA